MSGFFLVNQAPFQFVWCSDGLGQYQTGALGTLRYNLAPTNNATGGVYASVSGSSPNTYKNNRGALTYSFVKTGQTTGTLTSAPPYTDSVLASTITSGVTNYTLTITEAGAKQSCVYKNVIAWGAI
jgi:hypothetical protein